MQKKKEGRAKGEGRSTKYEGRKKEGRKKGDERQNNRRNTNNAEGEWKKEIRRRETEEGRRKKQEG